MRERERKNTKWPTYVIYFIHIFTEQSYVFRFFSAVVHVENEIKNRFRKIYAFKRKFIASCMGGKVEERETERESEFLFLLFSISIGNGEFFSPVE